MNAAASAPLALSSPPSPPSLWAPAGAEAAALHELTLVLVIGAAMVFVGTMALLARALRRAPGRPVPSAWWIAGGGIALPGVLLTALLAYGTARTAGLERALADPPLLVTVTGRLWWWEVRYRDPASGRDIVLANELRLPLGRPAQIALASADVVHSFWVPALGGKRDLVPGRLNHLVVTPTRAGTFRGQCAEYCGEQHARMALHVVVLPAADFGRWLAQQAAPAGSASSAAGRQAFVQHGCATCHAVRGLAGQGGGIAGGPPLGPDLTHVASRLQLGAGVLPNEPGAYRRWLVGVQELKPGARMPSYAHLDAATLQALSEWLATLR